MTFADPALATGEATLDRRLEAFGAVVAEEIEPAVAELEACRDLPATDGERGRIPACLRAGRAGGLGLGNRQGSRLRAGGAALPARARGRRRSRLPGRLHRGPRPGARARGLTRARIRKLKDKLGTRALATGEIEFDRALGYAIGAPEDGFRIAAGVVLNTSRWLNALGTTGLMRRAYLVASAFAHERTAFGRPIVEFPLVRENLAVMNAETQAAFASTLELTRLVERIDAGTATEDDVTWHRILVNANKFVTSLAATRVMRRAIETLGGNGTIEDFSPLPRLYRDAIVFESWEGTHNVLCLQVLRDLARLDAVDLVVSRAGDGASELEPRLRGSVDDPEFGALHIRRQVEALVRALQAALLDGPAATLIARRHLTRGWDPETDPEYSDLIDAVLAA